MRVDLTLNRRNSYFIVTLLGLIALLSKFLFNGLIYGLDYSLFHPDGTLYTFRTLNWLGYSQNESAQLVSNWYAQHAGKMTSIIPNSLFFELNPNWTLYKFRVLYSALSMPFVYIFGIYGMLAIPALSFLGMLFVLLEIGFALKRVRLALILIFFISISLTVTRWMFINTTDSLFAVLATLSTYLLIKWRPSRRIFLLQFTLVLLMVSTRVAAFYVRPLIVMLYFKSKKQAMVLFLLAAVSSVPLFLSNIQSTIAITNSSGDLNEKILVFVTNSIRLIFIEMGQLIVLDRILFAILISGIFLAFRNLHRDSSRFLLLSVCSTYFMSILNGTIGVNFRFQLTIIGALAWVLLENLPAKYQRLN